MFKPKIMVIIVCIILLLVGITYTVVRFEKDSGDELTGDGSVTFYDLFMDFDTTTFKFDSYEPGDTVTVKDTISKIEIRENISVDHKGKDYEFSVNVWLDSLKEHTEYYEKPTLSVIGDHNKSTMQSNFRVGDDITINFTVRNCKPESMYYNSTRNDCVSRSAATGLKILNIYGTLNYDRTGVEEIRIKAGMLPGTPDFDIYQGIYIEISWEDNDSKGIKSGETTLLHYNNTALHYEILKYKEIENNPGVYIVETMFDYMEKPIPTDIFGYDTIRDMPEHTISEGILTAGDQIIITLDFSNFSKPPTDGGLNPESFGLLTITPIDHFSTLRDFRVPNVFPKEGNEIELLW